MTVQELKAWQRSRKFVKDIYKSTEQFPKSEVFGLTSQIRRSAVSVVSNIAEGHDRGTKKEFIQFLIIARGSVTEVQTQLVIANDLDFINESTYKKLFSSSIEIHKMINGLIKSMR